MSPTILLADHHAVFRDGLRALLEQNPDFKVAGVASNGEEAVEETIRLHPDVIVMGIAMPVIDGLEATRRIVEQLPESRVLILTMYSDAEHIDRALQAGAKGYMLKESCGAELVEAIQTLYAGHRYFDHKIASALADNYLEHNLKLSPLETLSLRERDVLQYVVKGETNAVTAQNLSLSPKTVETYRARILKKLDLKNTVELVKFAMRHGLIT